MKLLKIILITSLVSTSASFAREFRPEDPVEVAYMFKQYPNLTENEKLQIESLAKRRAMVMKKHFVYTGFVTNNNEPTIRNEMGMRLGGLIIGGGAGTVANMLMSMYGNLNLSKKLKGALILYSAIGGMYWASGTFQFKYLEALEAMTMEQRNNENLKISKEMEILIRDENEFFSTIK